MSETVMGIWTSLVRLSGTGGRGAAAAMAASPAQPISGASNIQALTPTKPIQKKSSTDGMYMYIHVYTIVFTCILMHV